MQSRALVCHGLRCAFLDRPLSRQYSSAESFLNSFRNYEQLGVPDSAGRPGDTALSLHNLQELLHSLGNPQHSFPVVHIAGTKGKGSTAAFLSSILAAAGYKAGTYTSPHVRTIRERIAVANNLICSQSFDSLVARNGPVIEKLQQQLGGALTYFEVLTSLAFRHFEADQVQIAVVEAGLGGATDATNVFSPKMLHAAIITALGREHERALGAGLANIAAAKAGIMKEGRPVVLAHQPEPEAETHLLQHAALVQCPVTRAAQVVAVEPQGIAFAAGAWRQQVCISLADEADHSSLQWQNGCSAGLQLLGEHQCSNAATAIACALLLRSQGWHQVTGPALLAGLEQAHLPGRFQVMRLEGSSSSHWVVLDGAHTPPAAQALSATLRTAFPQEPLALVVGMAGDKDHLRVMQALQGARPSIVSFVSVAIASSAARTAAPGTLAAHWQAASMSARRSGPRCRATIQASILAAVDSAVSELEAKQQGPGVICICGSLHAVGEALHVLKLEHTS